jgi:RNA recognition motif-containing protein
MSFKYTHDPAATLAGLQSITEATSRTLWFGEVESWMNEGYIAGLFAGTDNAIKVKIIRDQSTGLPLGYAFIDFSNHEIADRVLHAFNGLPIPNTSKRFRLNWAQQGFGRPTIEVSDQQIAAAPVGYDNTLFISDLDPATTHTQLFETFSRRIPGVISARIVSDPVTNKSRGFGFVKFATARDSQRALVEMQNALCGTRAVRLSPAMPMPSESTALALPSSEVIPEFYSEDFVDSSGCTIFIKELGSLYKSEEALRGYFHQFGAVSQIKVLASKNCGFVRFSEKASADKSNSFLNDLLARGDTPILTWIKVGPTFDLRTQLMQSQVVRVSGVVHEGSRKDVFMRKLDVTDLNLDYVALHCDQYLELTEPEYLLH